MASAGGLAAIGAVLERLPTDFPGAVIALQHVSPDRPSSLAEILERSSALPVREARDGDPLAPGQDGATGATAIHKHGSVVLATDEATSHAFAIPLATIDRDSIRPTVVPVDAVADALVRLVLDPTA